MHMSHLVFKKTTQTGDNRIIKVCCFSYGRLLFRLYYFRKKKMICDHSP